MPIHLPAITRRRFLTGAMAAGATFLLDRSLWAAGREVDPHSWALISDTHLAADRQKIVRKVNMTDNFIAVAAEVLALPQRPVGALINGDLAYNAGEASDYAVLNDLLRPLREDGLPIHLTLGNHDDRGRFWETFAELKSAPHPVPDHQVSIVRGERANIFILDSLDHIPVVPGMLGDAQRAWLARALDENADKPALVIGHHNLGHDPKMTLQDTDQLLEIIRPRKQVKAYIFGHTHDWEIQKDPSGLQLVNLPPTAYVFMEGKPNGWVHLTLQTSGARLELRCVGGKHPDHGQVVNLQWREG